MAENPEKIRFIPLSGTDDGPTTLKIRVVDKVNPSAFGPVDGTLIIAPSTKETIFFNRKEARI